MEIFDNFSVELIPETENDTWEFKSSLTPDKSLKEKIQKAVSGFSNSGGGFFVVGIDENTGKIDGGISSFVGKQSRRDWIDRIINEVEPTPKYDIKLMTDAENRGHLNPSCVLVIIHIPESLDAPHKAPAGYYIRAGAHTEPAKHFILEAIRLKRYHTKPILTYMFRLKPEREQILQLGIIALTDAPAIDVNINLEPLPPFLEDHGRGFPINISIIDRLNPFYFDVSFFAGSNENFGNGINLQLSYKDIVSNSYSLINAIGVDNSTVPVQIGTDNHSRTIKAIDSIKDTLSKALSNKRNQRSINIPFSKVENLKEYIYNIMPDLINEMKEDIEREPFIREFILFSKKWMYNSIPTNDLFEYYYETHPYLRNKIRILENCGLVYDITFNDTDRFIFTENFISILTE